jgi:predicted hotdog family 3-hydroxylacyl-ACP dehydratase
VASQKDYDKFDLEKNMVHKRPMLLVDKLLNETETTGRTFFAIKPDCIFLDKNGVLMPSAFVEIAAQSFAATDIFQKKMKFKKHSNGFLTAARDFIFFQEARVYDEIICDVIQMDTFEKLHLLSAELKCAKTLKLFAKGEIRIYEID